ncbi:hypothetical protein C8J57DRAFT_1028134, partial [Mycena rebaudengoi]
DIRTYLCDAFVRIRRACLSGGIILEDPWPPHSALDRLVEQSAGMFIYAATAMRFIDDESLHPNDRLQSI